MPRLIALGDIHGHYNMLRELIKKIEPEKEDKFVFLGDYIDRGKHGNEVIEFLLDFKEEYNCTFLRGNHEDMLLDFLGLDKKAKYGEAYLFNGGKNTMISYAGGIVNKRKFKKTIPQNHLDFFMDTRVYYVHGKYLFVHGGIKSGVPIEKQKREDILWLRDEFIYAPTKLEKIVVFGHTPKQEVLIKEDKIGVDTGAGYNKNLSAIELNTKNIYTVKGKEKF